MAFRLDKLAKTGDWKKLGLVEIMRSQSGGITRSSLVFTNPTASLAVQWFEEEVDTSPFPGNAYTTAGEWMARDDTRPSYHPSPGYAHRALKTKDYGGPPGTSIHQFNPDLLKRLLSSVDDDLVLMMAARGGILVSSPAKTWFAWVGKIDPKTNPKTKRLKRAQAGKEK